MGILQTMEGSSASIKMPENRQILAPPPENMEIDTANSTERMEIDENGNNEAKDIVIYQNKEKSMVERSQIDSTGGVE